MLYRGTEVLRYSAGLGDCHFGFKEGMTGREAYEHFKARQGLQS